MNYRCAICNNNLSLYLSLFCYNYLLSVNDKEEKGCLYCTKHGLKVAGQCTQLVDELLSIVFKHAGKVVGSYVREYLIAKMEFEDTMSKSFNDLVLPMLLETELCYDVSTIIKDYQSKLFIPPLIHDPKNLNVWVQGLTQFESILSEYKEQGFNVQHIRGYDEMNKFPVYLYHITNLQNIHIHMYFIVASTFPINDFSFDLISWDGKQLHSESTDGRYTLDIILEQIKTKKGFLLPGYNLNRFFKLKQVYDFTLEKQESSSESCVDYI